MQMPMVQIRIMWMFMCYRVMGMEVRMPFSIRNGFSIVRMGMMSISMLMIMNMLHNNMCMLMFVRKQVGNNNSKRQKNN